MPCLFDRDVIFDCDAVPVAGVNPRVIILNYSDWKNATVAVDGATDEITSIVLAAGGVEGYEVQVPKENNIAPSEPIRIVDGVDGYDHTVAIMAATMSQLDRKAFSKMRFNRVVMIVPLNDGRAMLYGAGVDATPNPVGVGMRLSASDFMPGDPGLGNILQITAKTPDTAPPEVNVPHLIAAAFNVDDLLTPTA